MTSPVGYELNDSVATITMDDGKVNVLGPDMQAAINEALDRAEKDSAKAVVLAGNERVFSGGFDLWCSESGKLPHRPELAAVACRVDAAGIWKFARIGEIAAVVESRDVFVGVDSRSIRWPEIVVNSAARSVVCAKAGASTSRSHRSFLGLGRAATVPFIDTSIIGGRLPA